MKYGGVVQSLDNILSGTLNFGIVPLTRIWREGLKFTNVAPVAVGAAMTTILDTSIFSPTLGDLIIVNYHVFGTKAAVAGAIDLEIRRQSGSALFGSIVGGDILPDYFYCAASILKTFHGCFMFRPSDNSDHVFRLQATSAGSNFNIGAGDAKLAIAVLRGSVEFL